MARTQIPIHWCGGLDLSVAQVTVFVAACRKYHQVIPNGNYWLQYKRSTGGRCTLYKAFFDVFISELLALICSYCQCSSISDLLCGCLEVNLSETCAKDNSEDSRQTFNTMFPSGLFKHILDYLKPYLLKDTWKKSPLARHVLVWCTLGLKVWGN